MSETCTPDEMEIRELISRQFECLNWSPDEDADWDGLVDGFVAGATLFGAKRPASPQTPEEFAERMKALRDNQGVLEFAEKGICCEVFVIGNVAIAAAGCEMTENQTDVTRDISCFLLVKNPEGWRVAAQGWDYVDDIPAAFSAAGLTD
ncbi:MAG: hypothetical protein F4145_12470 [Boseongicola sp. SB0675_bin_26]|nr:hypothetical protein [Boseongicola sp. SB0675_bin_26]